MNIHEYENAKELAQKAFKIFAKNLEHYHYLSGLALLQEALLTMAVTLTTESDTHTQNSLDAVKDIFSKLDLQHHPGIRSLVEKLESTGQLQSEELMTLSCFQLVDYPFSWIDFHPSKHFVIFGADSQVWEHLEKLKIWFPFKYQWFKVWMGEFHKLSNLHQRVGKRFLQFHLEKHAYLDDPTPAKLQKFIKLDDFGSSNDFFLTDVLAGISELLLVCSKASKESDTITFTDLHSFYESYEDHHPEMKLIKQYFLRNGPCLIGLLEAQKFGNYDLNLATTKMLCPLNFTTRATHYAPDTVGHIRNMENLSASEKEIGRFLFTFNRRKDPGHRIAQDQALEANFNRDNKNDLRIGTAKNVIKRAALCQRRQESHKLLHSELTRGDCAHTSKRSAIQTNVSPDNLLRLRAAWRKAFSQINFSNEDSLDFEDSSAGAKQIHSLHDNNVWLNPEVLQDTEVGHAVLQDYVKIKEL